MPAVGTATQILANAPAQEQEGGGLIAQGAYGSHELQIVAEPGTVTDENDFVSALPMELPAG